MYGVGYPVLEHAVGGHYVILALLGLLAAKILATSLTMWIGGSGGVFAPRCSWARCSARPTALSRTTCCPASPRPRAPTAWSGWAPCSPPPPARRSPALIIIFELTGDYRIILPLMCAIVVATALSNAITKDTIYTLKLRRRGIDIDAPPRAGWRRSPSLRRWATPQTPEA